MNEPQRPLVPQFSLRWILGLTAALAVVCFVVLQALRGAAWAAGISVGFAALALAFAIYAGLFAIAWLTAQIVSTRKARRNAQSNLSGAPLESANSNSVSSVALFFAGTLTLFHAATAWGASGGSFILPLGQTNSTGLTLIVNTSWVDVCGYRPVKFTLSSNSGPSAADRVLSIEFSAASSQFDSIGTMVMQVIELPAGATSATATMSVPQQNPWMTCEWNVYEDGSRIEELSSDGRVTFSGIGNTYFADGGPPTVLALSGHHRISVNDLTIYGQTDASVIFVGQRSANANMYIQRGKTPTVGNSISASAELPTLASLPTHWIDYSGICIVLTSLDELKALAKQNPAQWQAIRKWLENGGTLIVYGVGDDWTDAAKTKLAALEAITDPLSIAPGSDDFEADPLQRGWRLPNDALRDQPLIGADSNGAAVADMNLAGAISPSTAGAQPPLAKAPFAVRRCGNGIIAAIRSDEKFTGQNFQWTWLYNTIGPEHWQWYQRFGVSMVRENLDFQNFLIPGVGAAPVTQFLILITLFVIGIGPVNYYLLRRIGKLNLLVITVPAFAAVITAALFLYAVLADGLGVRLRARSLTQINQQSGEASCWARLSYYAGLTPSGGLKFSEHTAVVPLKPNPSGQGESSERILDWTRINRSDPDSPLEQHLTSGWLNARTPTQFMTVRAQKTSAKLLIEQATTGQAIKATNQLGVDIQCLILIDEQKKCFTAKEVSTGQAAQLTEATSQSDAAMKLIEPLMVENEPRADVPIDYSNRGIFGPSRFTRYSPYGGYNSGNASAVQQSTSVLETAIRRLREELKSDSLPPRSYLAVVKTSPEMEVGTPAAHEESSFHLVYGQW